MKTEYLTERLCVLVSSDVHDDLYICGRVCFGVHVYDGGLYIYVRVWGGLHVHGGLYICGRVYVGVHVYGGLYICGGVQVEEDDKQVLVTRERQRACWLGVR